MASEAGVYWVTGIGNGHCLYDTIIVKADPSLCDCEPFLPDAFTPDEDGMNDQYAPIFRRDCYISNYSFFIYNRWGQQVFSSTQPSQKWNGTFKGAPANVDVYMYYLKYSTNPNYPEHVRKGDITLIR